MNVDSETNWKKEKTQILAKYNLMAKCMHELNSQMKIEETNRDAHPNCDQNTRTKK